MEGGRYREYIGVVSKLFFFHISYRTNKVGGDGNI